MADFFSILNSILRTDSNYLQGYGDIINESKGDERLQRGMTQSEISYFKEIKELDQKRMFESCGINMNNDKRIDKPINNMSISGIGTVSQVM